MTNEHVRRDYDRKPPVWVWLVVGACWLPAVTAVFAAGSLWRTVNQHDIAIQRQWERQNAVESLAEVNGERLANLVGIVDGMARRIDEMLRVVYYNHPVYKGQAMRREAPINETRGAAPTYGASTR